MHTTGRFVRNHLGATALATVAVIGLGGGSLALAQEATSPPSTASPPSAVAPAPGTGGATPADARGARGARKKADPAREAWAHQYGIDRSTMPQLAPVADASPEQQAAATDLLVRTETATARYADINVARAAGYDLETSLARKEKKRPKVAGRLQQIDTGGAMTGEMPMLHVGNKANKADGKVLDPTAPETLMYGYAGHGAWKLVGVMFTANESFPAPPPDPGGPITRWHYHDKSGGRALMMHVFFVPDHDLARAYASDMKA
ncbi:MAG: hypothetical protein ABIS47_14055 [Acidimicrobiales bacterium]